MKSNQFKYSIPRNLIDSFSYAQIDYPWYSYTVLSIGVFLSTCCSRDAVNTIGVFIHQCMKFVRMEWDAIPLVQTDLKQAFKHI